MKTAAEYVAAAHSNSMPPGWCAAKVETIRVFLNEPGAIASHPQYRTWLIELLSQLDSANLGAVKAVQAALDDSKQYNAFLLRALRRPPTEVA